MPVTVEVKSHERAAVVTKVDTIWIEHGSWRDREGDTTCTYVYET